jgi:geranylgeranyl diphosphate synthase type I
MLASIQRRLESELRAFLADMDAQYGLTRTSPLLYRTIREFAQRPGKRARPLLFVIGYLGYAAKAPAGLYRSAASLELLHDFMLVHDDIIDKSDTRRGRPSMHRVFDAYLKNYKDIKFNGQDLAIIAGDVMYALALHAFLSVRENPLNKERAFKKLITAALLTGSGEFIELMYGLKPIEKLTKEEIYLIYDLKTAHYTFATPLETGALLAGIPTRQLQALSAHGMYLGRAFQIKDDIIGMFSEEEDIGKSPLTDLQESKKTILIWHAYRMSSGAGRAEIRKIFAKRRLYPADLFAMRRIVTESGALNAARTDIRSLIRSAEELRGRMRMRSAYANALSEYSRALLSV